MCHCFRGVGPFRAPGHRHPLPCAAQAARGSQRHVLVIIFAIPTRPPRPEIPSLVCPIAVGAPPHRQGRFPTVTGNAGSPGHWGSVVAECVAHAAFQGARNNDARAGIRVRPRINPLRSPLTPDGMYLPASTASWPRAPFRSTVIPLLPGAAGETAQPCACLRQNHRCRLATPNEHESLVEKHTADTRGRRQSRAGCGKPRGCMYPSPRRPGCAPSRPAGSSGNGRPRRDLPARISDQHGEGRMRRSGWRRRKAWTDRGGADRPSLRLSGVIERAATPGLDQTSPPGFVDLAIGVCWQGGLLRWLTDVAGIAVPGDEGRDLSARQDR